MGSCPVVEWKGFLLESHWGFNLALEPKFIKSFVSKIDKTASNIG